MLKQDMQLISFAEFAITEYRYDAAGRLVAERDGRLEDGVWNLYTYDGCGRQVAKYRCGMMDSELEEFASVCRTASLTTSADEYDRGGYMLAPEPVAWPGDVVWAKYYDDYRFVAVRGLGTDFAFEATAAAPAYASATGLLTGMYTGAGHEVYYYDGAGCEIQRYATGYNRGRRSSVYNYDGSLARQTFSYPPGSGLGDMEKVYTYDRCGRLVSSVVRVSKALRMDTTLVSLASSSSLASLPGSAISPSSWAEASLTREYDAIGRLARVNHGSGAAVTSYGYDVHGWVVSQSTAWSICPKCKINGEIDLWQWANKHSEVNYAKKTWMLLLRRKVCTFAASTARQNTTVCRQSVKRDTVQDCVLRRFCLQNVVFWQK